MNIGIKFAYCSLLLLVNIANASSNATFWSTDSSQMSKGASSQTTVLNSQQFENDNVDQDDYASQNVTSLNYLLKTNISQAGIVEQDLAPQFIPSIRAPPSLRE